MDIMTLIILLQPDYYIYIGWGILLLLSVVALLICRKVKRRWVRLITTVPLLLAWYVFIYGTYVGFYKFEVKHVELAFDDLPPAFDGYKIVLWSDAHVGTLTGRRAQILQRAIDSINAQKADMVAFTGDLQNKCSDEITPFKKQLSSIKAKDGVYSVLGNHDYPMNYSNEDDDIFEVYADFGRRCSIDEELGWYLLGNSHTTVRRGDQHIIVAGMENDSKGRFQPLGDVPNTLLGLGRDEFVVMLEHDPTAWRRKILPHSHTQLTLSGHTHAMQFALFGLSPVSLFYKEAWGLYSVGQRRIYVTKGLGGVIPFRFGTPGEIVVITLKRNN